MKRIEPFKTAVLLSVLSLCIHGCSKSSGNTPTQFTPSTPTAKSLLTSSPWKLSTLAFIDGVTNVPYVIFPTPDSVKNLVLTFNADNTFTETGGKTASGTWAFYTELENVVTLTTTSSPASKINWTYTLTSSLLDLSNSALKESYVNPTNTFDYYQGEQLSFTH